jgi:hypothetical protein
VQEPTDAGRLGWDRAHSAERLQCGHASKVVRDRADPAETFHQRRDFFDWTAHQQRAECWQSGQIKPGFKQHTGGGSIYYNGGAQTFDHLVNDQPLGHPITLSPESS